MEAVLLNIDSKSDMKLLLEMARKIGIRARVITESELGDIGLINAIRQGGTEKYFDNESFLKKLRK